MKIPRAEESQRILEIVTGLFLAGVGKRRALVG